MRGVDMKKETLVTHQPRIELPEGNEPIVAPIYQSVKFTYESYADIERLFAGKGSGYFYSRVSNPTVAQLETLAA
jgi:O-acetylhomoserine/O-acetylserine sulfhydrylase-like pyridoxal-dependent enzyme